MAFARGFESLKHGIVDENNGQDFQTPGAKNILSTGRKHAGPKQAFGELKNTFHTNKQFGKPFATPNIASASKSRIQEFKENVPTVKQDDYDEDLESIWSAMSVLKHDEIERIINAKTPQEKLSIPPREPKIILPKKHDLRNVIDVDLSALDCPTDEWNDLILDF